MIWAVTFNPSLDITWHVPDVEKPISYVTRAVHRAGGKGNNVARAIRTLGGTVTAVGPYGGAVGQAIQTLLNRQGIPVLSVDIPDDNRICVALAGTGNAVTEIREQGPMVSVVALERLLVRLVERVSPDDWVTLSGSLPSGLSAEIYFNWVKFLRPKVAGVIVDTAGDNLRAALRANPTAVTPNEEEALALLAENLNGDTYVLVTRGAQGVTLYGQNQAPKMWQAPHVEMVNSVGAGDAFLGGLVYALANGSGWEDAIILAVAAGSASVRHFGIADFDPEDVLRLIAHVTRIQ
ncbi:tagatose-6-phosphate kinase [Sulfobacillus acidophilus TPY]|uniref:Tagatose-6-phosphate kinase n=1 Tax=Sulfobacillus acidophilus (strain ATCC 700253 / DSM 10332 / NAL) TaxID=679936 RepID=G8TTL9_SULAD|nr:tagatose-6-phosphate kinase [Sulfobacillus acidophilus TPY]AEW05685.1 1-phosphofructokinase [Sulfobacillus acidophilus DSM 10332]